MICVTGAGGTVGSELVRQLQSAGIAFRCTYFTKERAQAARERGLEAVLVDYGQPGTLGPAFDGCEKLFLLGPNALNQSELELNVVAAAQANGVQYIVKQSVMRADEMSYELARAHRPVEQAIESSGLDWTFLRPNSFMQNAVTFMSGTIRSDSAFFSASEQGRISHVDVRDIAAVAVTALTEPGHAERAYELTGPEALSYDELAKELTNVLGRTINHVSLSPSDLKAAMLADGMPEGLADGLLDLERFFRENHASRVTDDVRRVTGREPRSYADYIQETAATGVWDADNE
jgi:uncharacterized protein YbjT (DUF2867 family)